MKVLCYKFPAKVAFSAILKNRTFMIKLLRLLLGQLLETNGLIFTPTSGHTDESSDDGRVVKFGNEGNEFESPL